MYPGERTLVLYVDPLTSSYGENAFPRSTCGAIHAATGESADASTPHLTRATALAAREYSPKSARRTDNPSDAT